MTSLSNNDMIKECLKIYMGNYSKEQQYASSILLKMILKEKQYIRLMNCVKEVLGFKVNNRNDSKVIVWKRKVKKIGRCEICNATENLVAHHLIPWEYSITGRIDIKNGKCLCEDCHKMIHNDEAWINYMRGVLNG